MSSSSVYGGGRTVGRGPSGRIRNMGAMLDPKLIAVERLLTEDGRDPEALDRCRAEMRRRGFPTGPFARLDGASYTMPARQAAVVTMPTEAEVQDEYDELLRWLAEL